ncbi:MAG: hypothetical protein ACT4QF_21500 [Sporichthyaceae bacterium]
MAPYSPADLARSRLRARRFAVGCGLLALVCSVVWFRERTARDDANSSYVCRFPEGYVPGVSPPTSECATFAAGAAEWTSGILAAVFGLAAVSALAHLARLRSEVPLVWPPR